MFQAANRSFPGDDMNATGGGNVRPRAASLVASGLAWLAATARQLRRAFFADDGELNAELPMRKVRKLKLRSEVLAPLVVVALIAAVELISRPLHERGILQSVTGYLNGLSGVVKLPGLAVAQILSLRPGHDLGGVGLMVMLAVNFGFYYVAIAVFRRILVARAGRQKPATMRDTTRDERTAARALPSTPPRHRAASPGELARSRRRFLTTSARVATGAAAATLGWSLLAEPRWFDVTRRTFPVRGLHPELDGFRLVQLTDIHLGPFLSLGYVESVVRAANALGPDLIALTGDYVHDSPAYVRPVVAALAHLKATAGVVGVLGNHDWWEDGLLTQQEFRRAGIPLVDNARLFLTPDRTIVDNPSDARGGVCLAGVGDLWENRPRYDDALGGVPSDMPRLLLSHNPDVAEERGLTRGGYRVDLMLSGHTHGGQIRLPGLGTPVLPSRYGQKYASGLVQGPACPVYVSRGIGMAILPLRFRVRPEVTVIELRVG
jgi:predicted MPP superfamily phosphohydrolase